MTTSKGRPGWTRASVAGEREPRTLAGTLGRDAQVTRRRRRVSQGSVAEQIGVSPAWLGQIERGLGANAPLVTWAKLGIGLGRPLAVAFSRDIDGGPGEPRDAATWRRRSWSFGWLAATVGGPVLSLRRGRTIRSTRPTSCCAAIGLGR